MTVCQRAKGIHDPKRPAYESVVLAMWDVAGRLGSPEDYICSPNHPLSGLRAWCS